MGGASLAPVCVPVAHIPSLVLTFAIVLNSGYDVWLQLWMLRPVESLTNSLDPVKYIECLIRRLHYIPI